MGGLSLGQWIQWTLATFVAGLTIAVSQAAYIHGTFAKISEVSSMKSDIKAQQDRDIDLLLRRLDSLDSKVDRLIERKKD